MSHKTEYANFAELRSAQREGVNYRIRVRPQKFAIAIIAPHAGTIEPSTGRIATAIADDDFNLYVFEAIEFAGDFRLN